MGGAIRNDGLRVSVAGWWAWAPGREDRSAWRDWAGAAAGGTVDETPPTPPLPMMLRRRTTAIGQTMIAGALACGEAARRGRCVLASRHGELSRTLGILDAQVAGELPSPAAFSLSVHHGLAGLLSIHTGNRSGHTALAAGPDSFGFGLLEAAACVAETPDEPVLLLYGDEPLPGPYRDFEDAGDAALPLVVALALQPARPGAALTLTPTAVDDLGVPDGSAALDFLRFLLGGAPAAVSRGQRLGWEWRRDA